uniref:WAP domain-containing protein n=1 Tax=Oryzias latipes TaxID=8090 RepID=A0A3P9MAK6_ORYLA
MCKRVTVQGPTVDHLSGITYNIKWTKRIERSHSGELEKKCPDRNGTIGLCAFLCFSDSECSNGELCCTNGCGGRDCTPPLIAYETHIIC